jgi:hypothetical protein
MDIEVLPPLVIGIVVLWLAAGEWICLDQESIEAPVCTCGGVLE